MDGRALHRGTPDPSFGPAHDGYAIVPACGLPGNARLAVDGDGFVLWAANCLVRVHADGSLDATFATATPTLPGFAAVGLERDHAGRFVLAGNLGLMLKVFRFNPDGSVDSSFGDRGSVDIEVPYMRQRGLRALALGTQGRILAAGYRGTADGSGAVVAALDADGNPDITWNGTGLVAMDGDDMYPTMSANAIAVEADGRVVASGIAVNGTGESYLLTLFEPTGRIDPTFGMRIFGVAGGPVSALETIEGLLLLPNHRFMLGSTAVDDSFDHRTQYTLVRTLSDGTLDRTFGVGGGMRYTIADPLGMGHTGDYNQLHAIVHDRFDDSVLVYGRTFFEDDEDDYVTLVRVRFDLVFGDGFDR